MTELRIVRSRRKTLALQVLPTGEIVARAPLRLPERDIHAFAEQHAAWLETAVARARAGSRAAQRAGILSEAELQRLRTAAQADLTERVTRLAARMGVDFAGITIRAQRTRWGSCSARGSLSFNCLLMLAPPEVREYVAAVPPKADEPQRRVLARGRIMFAGLCRAARMAAGAWACAARPSAGNIKNPVEICANLW